MLPISTFNVLLEQYPKCTMDVICICMLEAYIGPSPEHFTVDGLISRMILDQQTISHIPIGHYIYQISILGLLYHSRYKHPFAIEYYNRMKQEWDNLVTLVQNDTGEGKHSSLHEHTEPFFLTQIL